MLEVTELPSRVVWDKTAIGLLLRFLPTCQSTVPVTAAQPVRKQPCPIQPGRPDRARLPLPVRQSARSVAGVRPARSGQSSLVRQSVRPVPGDSPARSGRQSSLLRQSPRYGPGGNPGRSDLSPSGLFSHIGVIPIVPCYIRLIRQAI